MTRIITIFYFSVLLFLTIESKADGIWQESFNYSGKGYWGDADGSTVHSDLTGITSWMLDVSLCNFEAENDYVKTTTTSGGRLEALDCDGEAIWTSEEIDIKDYKNVSVQLNVSETGSGANATSKYIKVYFQLDGEAKTLFETNGENTGNFGAVVASQTGLNGNTLRIIIVLNSSYASDKLIVDEIVVQGDPLIEFSSNHISTLTVLSETNLEVPFEDAILPSSVRVDNFQITEETSGKQLLVTYVDFSDSLNFSLQLTVEKPTEKDIRLIVSGLQDQNGLVMRNDTVFFEWIVPCSAYSIVLNEIMADPYPAVDLPEYEYIELYNRTNSAVYLKQLQLIINDKAYSLPDSLIPADGYVVLTSSEAAEYYSGAVVVSKFPALKNTGGDISLFSDAGIVIDEVSYSSDWYQDDEKEEGGWSLERIDPDRFCGQENNWEASANEAGGSPGTENSVKKKNTDQLPAKIVSIDVVKANQLDVYFSEQLDSDCISDCQNYKITDGNYELDSLIVVTQNQVSLFFAEKFSSQVTYKLEMNELIDLCGNYAINKSKEFTYYEPEEHSLIFTEVLADPSPVVGLPEYEYIEIYNRSDFSIPLNNIELIVESKSYELGKNTIQPGEYLVLTSEEGASFLPNSIAVSSFPSLRNSSSTIQLQYNSVPIDQLTYYSSWFTDDEKQEGGWSLERMDLDRFCTPSGNWTSSVNPEGGTPGEENSVAGENKDETSPEIVDYEILSPNTIRVTFSEDIQEEQLIALSNYSLSPAMGNPAKIEAPSLSEVQLIFAKSLTSNTRYTLTISGISDGCGNSISGISISIELIQLETGDILISEVLFNPYPGSSDFVEIYNNSEKTVNLKNLYLANRDAETNLNEICQISSQSRWFTPGSYALCTKDSSSVVLVYYSACPECFCETEKFPSYPDDTGTVVLVDDSMQVVDEFNYSEKMHHPLIDDVEGVSLERLSYAKSTSNTSNWHSAAVSVGYATPGYANSQHREELKSTERITLDPECFSPNNDGYNDRLLIHYQLSEPGYSANVKVYDSQGRLVNNLIKNEILAQEGDWYWDGQKSDDTRSGLGIYIVLVELFDLNGNVKKYKKACTLTDRL